MIFSATRDNPQAARSKTNQFEILVRDNHKQAYHLAYRLTGDATEAEDLVQESFLRAYRFFHRYDRALPFSSWLYRIIANTHIDLVRRKGKLRTTSLDTTSGPGAGPWELPDRSSSPERVMLDAALEEPVQRALLSMTSEFRTAVLLADVEGLAYEEVAEIMGTSVGTVRSRIHRGRRQLKDHLMRHAPALYGGLVDEL